MSLRRWNPVRVRAIVAASVPKPMYSANVHSWTEILLTGTPRPAHSGAAALAVPGRLALIQTALAPARNPRTRRPRPSGCDIDPPPYCVGRRREGAAIHP